MLLYAKTDSIEKLNLSTRSHNVLLREGINTIENLISYSEDDFHNIKNLGSKSIEEILVLIQNIKNKDSEVCVVDDVSDTYKQEIKKKVTFIGADGQEYEDIPLKLLRLSVRAYNCLKKANIDYFSQLILKTEEELKNIQKMGTKSLIEIEEAKTDTILTPIINKNKSNIVTAHTLCQAVAIAIKEKIDVHAGKLYSDILPCCEEYMRDKVEILNISKCLDDESFFKCLYAEETIKKTLKQHIVNIIKQYFYGCSAEIIIKSMPEYFSNKKQICQLIDELLFGHVIENFDGEKYILKYTTFLEGAKQFLSEREYRVCVERISGKTLDEVGKLFDVTRERIRQIESTALRKLNHNSAKFKEDIYYYIFKKYDIEKKDFLIAFKEEQTTYNYLELVCKKHGVIPIEDILQDEQIPVVFKRAMERAIYKNYVLIGDERVLCTREYLSYYVLRTFATDEVTFEEFREVYQSLVEDIGKQDDSKFSLMDRGYENKLAASDMVLWKYGKKFRYYNMKIYDFTDLLGELNLNQYSNVEYSTLKFFHAYPELMSAYDIRDEYELHNLLKKICDKEEYSTINFKRMPNIEFGTADRNNQVMELLLTLTPISNNDFAKEYENEYGVRANTVLANYMKDFDRYFYNGMYKIDFPALPNVMTRKLNELLVDDFYLLSTIKSIYRKEFLGADRNLLNPYSLKSCGFKVYSNYAIRDTYNSATEYFNYILTNADIVDSNHFPKELKGIISYISELYKLKADYEIMEFMPNKYVNIRRLKQAGITKNMLYRYCEDVLDFIGDGKYFTVHSLKNAGFSHELDDFGFEDWFYTSILVEDKNNLSYQRIGRNKLILKGSFVISFVGFIESIVYDQDLLSIDIYELSDILKNEYNLNINTWKISETIKNSSMYYDAISEKIYADYDIYYEEI